MKDFIRYTVIWISANLAIPFWVLGHVHLSLNIYEDVYEIITSFGMNILVLIGFIMEYKDSKKNNKKNIES